MKFRPFSPATSTGITRGVLLLILCLLIPALNTQAAAKPSPITNTTTLIPNRAIAAWSSDIPNGEKRPVIVFLPGWGGTGAVDAYISGQNTNFVNQGYVTLAIGFDSNAEWTSDIDVKTKQGLDLLCADATIPANCNAIVLNGSSYGGSQNYWVIEHIRNNGYAGKALGFVSEDAGYAAPGDITDFNTGAFNRTGLANTAAYSVAMIENQGDSTFPIDDCTWGNCGARHLGDAHQARGDTNVYSMCPPGGEHGTRGYADWDAWVISAVKTIIHSLNGVSTFTGYTPPALTVGNDCVTTPINTQVFGDVPDSYWAASFIKKLFNSGITGGCSTSPLNYCPDNPVTRAQMAIFLEKGIHTSAFTPPNVSPTFLDTAGHFAEDWIEALKNDGITSGCAAGFYCPEDSVTRAQMAIFLLKATHGASYSPPPATGTFSDVFAGYWAAAWIERLAAEGITSGCAAGLYCPESAVTRAQMAVFLVKAFSLP